MRKKKNPKPRGRRDENQSAFDAMQKIAARTEENPSPPAKNPAAVALGRLGGLKGGHARAKALTHDQLSEIGRKAAAKRWGTGQ